MRRLLWTLALLTCLSALAVTGAACGDDEESSGPLGAGLSYLPAETPFAVAIDTDLDGDQFKAVDSILEKFPLQATSVKELVAEAIAGQDDAARFEDEVEPILGNPFVVGASDVTSFLQGGDTDFVAALEAADKDALDSLIEKSKSEETGETAGATKYEDAGTVFAVKDDVVVFAGSEELLDAALERAEAGDGLGEDTFDAALEGLPDSALARVYSDVQALLASDGGNAKKVKWVDALRSLGMTASATGDSVEVRFNLRTDPEGLTDEDLPIAAGEDSPPVLANDGEIGIGIRNPAQIVNFAELAGQSVSPSGYGDYEQAKKTLDARLDISVDDDIIGQMTGDLAASVALDGGFGVRAELKDPDRFERTLAKVADVLPSFAEGAGLGPVAIEKPSGGSEFYALAQADGDAVVFGVVDGSFVVSNDPDRAGELAGDQPESVDGAEGSVAMSADAAQLANALIRQFGPQFGLGGIGGFGAQLFTGPLEDLTGSMSADTEGIQGRFKLAVD